MKRLILLLALLFPAIISKSQHNLWNPAHRSQDFDRGMSLSLILPSFMTSPHSNLSYLLVDNGYPHIPRGSLNYGLALTYRIKKVEFGVDGLIGNQSVYNPYLNSELLRRPLNASLYVQYHLLRKGLFTLYPLVGFSMTDTNVILSKQPTSDDLKSLLASPGTSVNIQHYSEGILVGLGVAIAEHWVETTGTFNLKFAYRIPTNSYTWESKFVQLNNELTDSFPYFFVQLNIGFIGNWKKGDPWMDKY